MKVYHQAGHNSKWNIDSFEIDHTGDGVIFSPVHFPKDRFEGIKEETKKVSLFDPQFYIPDSQKAKLHSYDFFPEKLTNGFSTSDFEAVAHQAAEMCLTFQIEHEFESILVPARYYSELVTDYVARQKAFSVEPFLAEIEKRKVDKKIFLSLPMTIAMIQDSNYCTEVLNWITSYPEIHGVYLLTEMAESSKQIKTFEKLQAQIQFIKNLQGANLKVIVGYCNTEATILSALNPYALTIGAYENTRNFSIDKFLEDESEVRGPAARIYFPNLLNWMRYDTAIEIREDHPTLWKKIYSSTDYCERIFRDGRPHFTKPELYKHHFSLMSGDLKALSKKSTVDRIAELKARIKTALQFYREINDARIALFDQNCSGEHLPIWNRVLNKL